MVNILFNRYDIGAEWYFYEFEKYINAKHKVVIIPFSFRDEMINSNK